MSVYSDQRFELGPKGVMNGRATFLTIKQQYKLISFAVELKFSRFAVSLKDVDDTATEDLLFLID